MKINEKNSLTYSEANPSKTRLGSNSILNSFNILKDEDGNLFANIHRESLLREVVKTNRLFYDIHVAKTKERWDHISDTYYGSPYLWWVICWANDIIDPLDELREGTELVIIKELYISDIIDELEQIRRY